MVATGMIRKVDNLGRIVIPRELRSSMKIEEQTPLEIFTSENQVILQKYLPGCILTGHMEDLVECDGVKVSRQMVVKLAKAAGL